MIALAGHLSSSFLAKTVSSAACLAKQPFPRAATARACTSAMAQKSFYDFDAKDLVTNADAPLSQYEGQVSLVVNVASK